MGKMKNKYFIIPLIVIVSFYIMLNLLGIHIVCYFKSLTGIPCPGCGLTRAYLALFKGNLSKAFFYHPLFIVPVIVLLYFIIPKFKNSKHNSIFVSAICIIFIGTYIVRMILFFPHTSPLDFDSNALFPKIITRVFGIK